MNSKKLSQALVTGSTAATATPPSRPPATNSTTTPRAPAPTNGGNYRYNSRGRGRGRGNGRGNSGSFGIPTFNPFIGTFQVWSGYVLGVLGSRPHPLLPQGQQGHAFTASTPPGFNAPMTYDTQLSPGAPPGFGTPAAPPGFGMPAQPNWTVPPPSSCILGPDNTCQLIQHHDVNPPIRVVHGLRGRRSHEVHIRYSLFYFSPFLSYSNQHYCR